MSIKEVPLDRPHGVGVSAVVVDDGHVIVANVSLVELRVRLRAGHEHGRVVDHLHHIVLPHVVELSIIPRVQTT